MAKLIVANWKMNPATYPEAEALALGVLKFLRKIKNAKVVLCPPFVWLMGLSHKLKFVSWGAQDVFWEERGSFTGEISSAMLKNSKVDYVIIGHSERRHWLHETDEMINKKVLAALRAGLKVILCVGEPAAVRKKGFAAAKNFVAAQLKKDLRDLSIVKGQLSKVIVAYEPIWAIGTGKSDHPADTAEMAKFIKNFLHSKFYILNSRVLYGGSVNSKNIKDFAKRKEIDGALVGGASLKLTEFKKIISLSAVKS